MAAVREERVEGEEERKKEMRRKKRRNGCAVGAQCSEGGRRDGCAV